jgi:hypothetical protein
MTNALALSPFPNAIFWNWATIFILAFGNRKFVFLLATLFKYLSYLTLDHLGYSVGALDFQVRCMAAKTPRTAVIGCVLGGLITFFIGIPFSYLGAITR